MNGKVFATPEETVFDVPDGASIMFGGFGGAGFPNNLIRALATRGT
jgi:acyl CoA:acetate/3-ketoacid CoA transferase alpha subunit